MAAKLDPENLRRFRSLRSEALSSVLGRLCPDDRRPCTTFGARGLGACADDLGLHLDFLDVALEAGTFQPFAEYLDWAHSMLASRGVPSRELALSLDWLEEFFRARMGPAPGGTVGAVLAAGRQAVAEAESRDDDELAEAEAWPEAAAFERALLAARQREAAGVVDRLLDNGRSLVDVERHVMQPALYGIGAKWQANQVTVVQEHIATAMVQSIMALGLTRAAPAPEVGRKVLLACVEGNQHAVGLRMVADAFQIAGWEVQYLGADTPTQVLINHAEVERPDVVGLSVSFPHQLREARALVAGLEARIGSGRPLVMVGGLAFNRAEQLPALVGADASMRDPAAAVHYALAALAA